MIRLVFLCAVMAASAAAQNAVPTTTPNAPPNNSGGTGALAALEQTARQRTADWETLAQTLNSSIKPLLPCDPKAAAAITAVSRASDDRLAALAAYLQEEGRQASLYTAAARGVLASVQPLGADLSVEKSDLEQEQLSVNGQMATLTEIGQRRPVFNAAQDALRQIAALQQQRSAAVDSGIGHADATLISLRDLVAKLEAREQTLKAAQEAFAIERVRWNAYYVERLARSQTECVVTRGTTRTPAPQPSQGKQR